MALTPVTMTGTSKYNLKTAWTAFNTLITDLASTATGKGASCIGIYDVAGNFTAANVETAFAEVYTDHSAALSMSATFDENPATTTGLTWGYKGGLFRNDNTITTITAGTVSLTNTTTNYVEIGTDGVVYVVASAFTSGRIPIRTVVTSGGVQTTSTDKRSWFSAWPTAGSFPDLVDSLKVTVNATVNILDLFEKSTGVDPTTTYPIKIAIPDGTGVTWRTRSASVLSGTGSFTLVDGTGYWGFASLAGSSYDLYIYAIWSTADGGLVWGLSDRSDFLSCPTGTTNTDQGYMQLENSSSYTRASTDWCICVGTILLTYNTAAAPDYTFSSYSEIFYGRRLDGKVGEVKLWSGETTPSGWLECNGASLVRTSYARLFSIIGTNFGTADGTHFNIPDLRGKFPRGWDHAAANDPDRAARTAQATGGQTGDHVGTVQADGFKAHTHTQSGYASAGGGVMNSLSDRTGADTPVNTGSTGGNETRPINVGLMFVIKY